jgi:hypothetical protein
MSTLFVTECFLENGLERAFEGFIHLVIGRGTLGAGTSAAWGAIGSPPTGDASNERVMKLMRSIMHDTDDATDDERPN